MDLKSWTEFTKARRCQEGAHSVRTAGPSALGVAVPSLALPPFSTQTGPELALRLFTAHSPRVLHLTTCKVTNAEHGGRQSTQALVSSISKPWGSQLMHPYDLRTTLHTDTPPAIPAKRFHDTFT